MNNIDNIKIYKRWVGLYDLLFGSKYISKQRKAEISMLNLKEEDNILFVGIGTGEDLRFIPKGINVTGVDITNEMLDIARKKVDELGLEKANIINMDGQNLEFEQNHFDYVVLNLILSVIPDGNKALKEAYRVLKPGGKIAIFDKFIEDEKSPNIMRLLLNRITKSLGTDINRKFSKIIENVNLKVQEEKKSILGGMYRIIILEK
ncbi:class I SAM-dependent methyltransferase [Clostridium intestinale]|uniref:Methyltransferase domain-containing protein n=1 Tax=Clostridium intestinale DSM 6191 TaxID=1121320 RepID=A0A1M6CVE5_9CLOT|nr:methyltransferase domain-containing protein [Clostridium intestinale]SHI64992.1 Methyltransferase domain-containing protein [Clostridium intestinale DSM 6191]